AAPASRRDAHRDPPRARTRGRGRRHSPRRELDAARRDLRGRPPLRAVRYRVDAAGGAVQGTPLAPDLVPLTSPCPDAKKPPPFRVAASSYGVLLTELERVRADSARTVLRVDRVDSRDLGGRQLE